MENIEKTLKRWLDDEKILHSMNVANTAVYLAKLYNVDEYDAFIAGALHDIARGFSSIELLKIARENNLLRHYIEENMPVVLHAPVGAFILERELDITDRSILDAISKHTTAAPNMNILDKIIYIADIIEPGRSFEGLDDIRSTVKYSLDEGFLKTLDGSIAYLIRKEVLIHPFTIDARNNIILATQY